MDETHNVLAVREGVKTPVTHGEEIRHPHTPDYVGLSMLNLLICVKVSMQMHKRWMPKGQMQDAMQIRVIMLRKEMDQENSRPKAISNKSVLLHGY